MKRREMMKRSALAVCGVVAGQRFSWAGSKESASLLLEAAQFQNHGGWGLDSQYMDIMGSGFLIAHGIGKSVEESMKALEGIDWEGMSEDIERRMEELERRLGEHREPDADSD